MKKLLLMMFAILGSTSLASAQNNAASISMTHSFRKAMTIAGSTAFPYDTAGIVAYTQVPANAAVIQTGLKAFPNVAQLGQNYVIGTVGGQNMYFDSNGWIVCYFFKGNFPANLITIDGGPQLFSSTVLSVPINTLLDTLGLTAGSYDIQYSDLEHPNADSLLAFWAQNNTLNVTEYVHFEIPSDYAVINQSLFAYAPFGGYVSGGLTVDGDGYGGWAHGLITNAPVGQPHTIAMTNAGFVYLILYSH